MAGSRRAQTSDCEYACLSCQLVITCGRDGGDEFLHGTLASGIVHDSGLIHELNRGSRLLNSWIFGKPECMVRCLVASEK
jgi:hypothetical protein